jgi:gamma-glutamylcyclotransferase (GGCT)/AIG2-like uncharacterized protein YtfP
MENNKFSALMESPTKTESVVEDEEDIDEVEGEEDSEQTEVETQVEIDAEKSHAKIHAILMYFNQSEDYMFDAVVKTMQDAIKSGNWMDI